MGKAESDELSCMGKGLVSELYYFQLYVSKGLAGRVPIAVKFFHCTVTVFCHKSSMSLVSVHSFNTNTEAFMFLHLSVLSSRGGGGAALVI